MAATCGTLTGVIIMAIMLYCIFIFPFTMDSRTKGDINKIRNIISSGGAYNTVKVEEFEGDYEANYLSAHEKYNHKKLRLIGRLSDIRHIQRIGRFDRFAVNTDYFFASGGYILKLGRKTECYFKYDAGVSDDELDKRMLQLRKGQMMSIEGVWMREIENIYTGAFGGLGGCEYGSWSVIS
ncbi:MAG: hypothetical protein IJU07_04650 [Synergistaceae bacterium]|nr:hypothetical protein [Synergistaceae bacterium]